MKYSEIIYTYSEIICILLRRKEGKNLYAAESGDLRLFAYVKSDTKI